MARTKPNEPKPLVAEVKEVFAENAELDGLDSQVTDGIRRVEDSMRSRITMRLTHDISTPGSDESALLTWGKHEGKWQLLIEEGPTNAPDDFWSATPLVAAPREVRVNMLAFGAIETLILSARKQLAEQRALRVKALAAAEALISALTEASSPTDDDIPF